LIIIIVYFISVQYYCNYISTYGHNIIVMLHIFLFYRSIYLENKTINTALRMCLMAIIYAIIIIYRYIYVYTTCVYTLRRSYRKTKKMCLFRLFSLLFRVIRYHTYASHIIINDNLFFPRLIFIKYRIYIHIYNTEWRESKVHA